jgi:signal transduction histidine kinase/CheY-like chemotaxis protein
VTTTKTVLLAADASRVDALAAMLRRRDAAMADETLIEPAQTATASAVARVRAARGSIPVGVIVESDADAIEAIAAGADEAAVVLDKQPDAIVVLVERTRARAALRLAHVSQREQVAHADKLAALGTVVAGVAHEINNPLAAVLLAIDALRLAMKPLFDASEELQRLAASGHGLAPDDVARLAAMGRNGTRVEEMREVLEETVSHVQTIADIVRDLRIYGRADDAEAPQLVHLPDLIDQVLRIVGPGIQERGHIERDYAPDLPMLALARSRVVQVITNVLVNASQAIAELDRPVHRVRISIRTDGEYAAVSIADTGPGIPPAALERIFDPFYTTKRVGAGTGLGLSISRAILRQLGGDLLAESVHGQGATFIALVPLPDPESLSRAYRRSAGEQRVGAPSRRRATVLIVEDDERLLRTYPRILRDQYDVIVACDGQEAIDLLVSGSRADVVLSDLAMPEVDGPQLFAWLKENRPELARRTIFVTGGASDAFAKFLAQVSNVVIAKPATRAQILHALGEALRND